MQLSLQLPKIISNSILFTKFLTQHEYQVAARESQKPVYAEKHIESSIWLDSLCAGKIRHISLQSLLAKKKTLCWNYSIQKWILWKVCLQRLHESASICRNQKRPGACVIYRTWAWGYTYKTFFMLNSQRMKFVLHIKH